MFKTKKGLWGFLLVGGLVFVLAAMGSGAWAAPNQSGLLQGTVPLPYTVDGFLCNNINPAPGCQFPAVARLGDAGGVFDTPIVGATVTLNSVTQTTQTNTDGYFQFTGVAAGPHTVTALGVSRTVNVGETQGGAQDFWPGMDLDAVGGYALPVNRFELLAPWIGLAALMGVVAAAVVVRRRR